MLIQVKRPTLKIMVREGEGVAHVELERDVEPAQENNFSKIEVTGFWWRASRKSEAAVGLSSSDDEQRAEHIASVARISVEELYATIRRCYEEGNGFYNFIVAEIPNA